MAHVTIFRGNDGCPEWATISGHPDDDYKDLRSVAKVVRKFITGRESVVFTVESGHTVEVVR